MSNHLEKEPTRKIGEKIEHALMKFRLLDLLQLPDIFMSLVLFF